MEQCKELKDMDDGKKNKFYNDFRMLRNISHNLGIETWKQTKLQTLFIALAIICYVISVLLK
jgi:hypothetical protein